MRKIVRCSIGMFASLLAQAGCVAADTAGPPAIAKATTPELWRGVDAQTGRITDIAELRGLAEAFPNSSSVRLRLLNAHLAAEDLESVHRDVLWLTDRKYQFREGAESQLLAMYESEQRQALESAFADDPAPVLSSAFVTEIPPEALLVEGLAVQNAQSMVATAVVSRDIWFYGTRNPIAESPEWSRGPLQLRENAPTLANPTGIAISPAAGADGIPAMVIASGDIGMLEEDAEGFNGIIMFPSAQDGIRSVLAPDGVSLSDIAFDEAGRIFASDPLGGGVWLATPGQVAMQVLVAPGTFRSPQGLVASADGRHLYLSDYRYGLAMVDLETRAVMRLDADIPILLDGIDALLRYGDELIAVQNGINPMQIVALQLDAAGNRIVRHRVLERAHPEWTEPLGAAIADGYLYYIANGQWTAYDEGGALKEGAEMRPTQIRRVELGTASPQ